VQVTDTRDDVKTKIVATVGPASEAPAMLERLARAGADVFRLNCAHGDKDWHDTLAERIRTVSKSIDKPLAILQDLAGPKIRLGELPAGAVQCALGERFAFVRSPNGRAGELTSTYPQLIDDLNLGDQVLLADGTVAMRVVAKETDRAEAEVTLPGEIRSRQGINLPGARLQLESLTEKDLRDLDGAVARNVDFIGMSFIRRPEDLDRLRAELRRRGSDAHIVAKIEKAEALGVLDGIIQRTDAVMVARGDLGVEIDVARVPMVQKQIIQRCHRFGVPVITATQMLESMRASNRPTRAEASDVANAILDGTDAVMLSAETATGQYPVPAVETMNHIAYETEKAAAQLFAASGRGWFDSLSAADAGRTPASVSMTPGGELAKLPDVAKAAFEAAGHLADRVHARLVVAATSGGHTALALSKQRNLTPTLGLSDQPATVRRMALYWGVTPVLFEGPHVVTEYVSHVTDWAHRRQLVAPGDRLVFVFGTHWADSSHNAVLVHEVPE
jgi:pyruvate kinase